MSSLVIGAIDDETAFFVLLFTTILVSRRYRGRSDWHGRGSSLVLNVVGHPFDSLCDPCLVEYMLRPFVEWSSSPVAGHR